MGWHNPNLLCQAEIVLFVRFLLLYTWLVFDLFPALLFPSYYPALDWYERACQFLPLSRHLWPSLVHGVQMLTPAQEEPSCACVRDMLPCPRYVHDMSKNEPSCACAIGKTRWVFLLVLGPWCTSPHTVWAWASSGQIWSPLSCPSWGYHHGCCVLRCYHMSHPLSARR